MSKRNYKAIADGIKEFRGTNKKLFFHVERRYDYYAIDLYQMKEKFVNTENEYDYEPYNAHCRKCVMAGLSLEGLEIFLHTLWATSDLDRPDHKFREDD